MTPPTHVEGQIVDAMEDTDTGPGQTSKVDLDDNKQLRRLLAESKKRLRKSEEKLATLQACVERLKGQGKVADDEPSTIFKLQEDNARKSQDLEAMQATLTVKERLVQMLQQKIGGSQDFDAKEEKVFSTYQKHLLDLSKQLEGAERKCRRQEREIYQLQRRLDHAENLEEQVTSYAIGMSRLEEEKKSLEKQLEQLRLSSGQPPAHTSHPSPNHRQLRKEVAGLEQDAPHPELTLEGYKQLYEEAVVGSKKLMEEISSLTLQVQQLQGSGGATEAHKHDTQPQEVVNSLEQEVQRLTSLAERKDRRIAALQKQLAAAQASEEELGQIIQHSKKQSKQLMQLKQERVALEVC